jgi:hypothetical protein
MPQIAGLSDDEISTADYFIGRASEIISQHGNSTQWLALDDKKLTGDGWTGHPDAVALAHDGSQHIFDWKFGWLDTPDASINLQLRVYAALLTQCEKIFCHIVGRTGTTSTLYTLADIADAKKDLAQIVENVQAAQNAPGNPGDYQCRYCRAFCTARCPETCALVPAAAETLPDGASIAALPAADVERSLPLLALVKSAISALEARAKALLAENSNAFGGAWILDNGNTRREITDAGKAYARTSALITTAQALSACKMSRFEIVNARTENIISEAASAGTKVTKKDAKTRAENEIDAALGELLVVKQNAPSLKFAAKNNKIEGPI